MKNEISTRNNRREFLLRTFSTCALCCLAAPAILSNDKNDNSTASDQKHKFLSDSGMTLQQVYNFAYKQWYIPAMKNLMLQIGKEKFLQMLKTSTEMMYGTSKEPDFSYNERTLSAFSVRTKKGCEDGKDRLTWEIIRNDGDVFEMKISECIWAKTFREADASEIGYAGVCYGDYPMAKDFNPKLKLLRESTLMEGHDCCHFKWTMDK
jgi:hypothetical protein